MKQPVHHVLDIYGTHLHLAWTRKQWRRLANELDFLDAKQPESAGLSWLAVWEPKGVGLHTPHVVLWIDHKAHGDDTATLVDSIAHEASHAALQILHQAGHQAEGTDEPSAYLTGWVAGWIWRHLHDLTT